jgi:hypothetical protein
MMVVFTVCSIVIFCYAPYFELGGMRLSIEQECSDGMWARFVYYGFGYAVSDAFIRNPHPLYFVGVYIDQESEKSFLSFVQESFYGR